MTELGPHGASILLAGLALAFMVAAIAQLARTRGGRLAVLVDDETSRHRIRSTREARAR